MRPTHGRLSLDGVMPMAPVMDTAGFFSRDAVKGRDFSKGWYGDLFANYTELPQVRTRKKHQNAPPLFPVPGYSVAPAPVDFISDRP
jgi:Asp-tRNA(Asn)/Glu-tRNA(Gln) amidotransferase A subunit family amidase